MNTRPISETELAVLMALLTHCAEDPAGEHHLHATARLVVEPGCECGCASIDIVHPNEQDHAGSVVLANGVGTTPAGGAVGLLVWGTPDRVDGLEVFDLGAGQDDTALPVPGSVKPFPNQRV